MTENPCIVNVQGVITMFTNKDLKDMMVPLFFEQLLVMMVGIADTFVVSYAGEAAVSGVSLVNMFNTIFIYLFTALASGGSVVISQYIGRKDEKNSSLSSSQLLMISTVFSLVITVVVLVFNTTILRLLFGKVDNDVMSAAVTYLRISAYSYPFIAICNAGAALYRSMGKTSTTMYVSLWSNVINVIGNCLGVFVLHAGVAGVAYPSLLARAFSAIVITILCFNKAREVHYTWEDTFAWDAPMLKTILKIAVPNGVENGIFQFVKVALSSIVALFGTYQIAANGVAQSIWSLAAISGAVMAPIYITVIGQCMGANDTRAANMYFHKLMKWTLIISVAWNALILAVTPVILHFYVLSNETKQLVFILVLIHNIFNAFVYPFSGPLSSGLRATGDVRFTMNVPVISTIAVRLVLSVFFGIVLNMGVIGIAFAMCADWLVRALLFLPRTLKGTWREFQVIH